MGSKQVQKAGSVGTWLGKSSKQMFLDLGQRDFSASKCSTCGMVYAKGHEEDEKLHKSFHQSAVQGLKFQGWARERVVLMEPFKGRLIMVVPTDSAPQIKKVQEVCSFVEKAHGIAAGWLTRTSQCKVFLYVSLQKRVVGLAVVEPIKQAYRVAAPGPVDAEADSCEPVAAAQQRGPQRRLTAASNLAATGGSGGSSMALGQQQRVPAQASGSTQTVQQEQQRPRLQQQTLLWPGLHRSSNDRKRSRLQALVPGGAASLGGGRENIKPDSSSELLPGSQGVCAGTTRTNGGSSAVKADSCPPSLLMAADLLQVKSSTAAAADPLTALPSQTTAAAALVQAPATGASAEVGLDHKEQQQVQQQQETLRFARQPGSQQPLSWLAGTCNGRSMDDCSRSIQSGDKAVASGAADGGGHRGHLGSRSALSAGIAAVSGGAVNISGGGSGARPGSSGRSRSSQAAATGASGFCMLADKRKAVHAMLGVRMVWVSAEQRRTGLATKLLDAARCNTTPGYVVPRNQLAFTQPTEEGAKLAVAFTGTQQFMVYGIE